MSRLLIRIELDEELGTETDGTGDVVRRVSQVERLLPQDAFFPIDSLAMHLNEVLADFSLYEILAHMVVNADSHDKLTPKAGPLLEAAVLYLRELKKEQMRERELRGTGPR